MTQTPLIRLRSSKYWRLARELRGCVEAWRQNQNSKDTKVVHLEARGQSRGEVLFSYIIDGFLLPDDAAIPDTHTNIWASLQMARTFQELRYSVDVISYHNKTFVPKRPYKIFVDVRRNLERLAPLLGSDCLKIMHVDTTHVLFHNAAEAARLLDLQRRRGVTLRPIRTEVPNLGIENADCATTTGNSFTIETFRYAGKPFYRVPIPAAVTCPWEENKDFSHVRNTFLWFSSGGLVHKGLDLALEAFAEMPELRLLVCCPIDREPQFARAFRKELYETSNITTIGWVGVNTPRFREVTDQCVGMVYTSCSEGGGACAVTGMHAGMIPVVNRETSIDPYDFGFLMREASVAEIKRTVRMVTSLPAGELRERSRNAWEYARSTHTRENFAREYKRVITEILAAQGRHNLCTASLSG